MSSTVTFQSQTGFSSKILNAISGNIIQTWHSSELRYKPASLYSNVTSLSPVACKTKSAFITLDGA